MPAPATVARVGRARSGAVRSGYPILVGNVAATYMLSGVARSRQTRSGYHSAKTFVTIGGVHYGTGRAVEAHKVLLGSLSVSDIVDATPNTATFTAMGFSPTYGADVVVTLGSKNNNQRTFAGKILRVDQSYLMKPSNPQYRVSCIDDTWGLNKRKVTGRYSGSATTIATSLVASYASGYTSTFVATGLPSIDEITFTDEDLTTALTRLCKRIGAYWYVDYVKAVHLFVGSENLNAAGLTNPTLVNFVHRTMHDFSSTRDLSQIVTRVSCEGGGANTLESVAVRSAVIPVTTADWYSTLGGTVVSGPQRITYTGRQTGGPVSYTHLTLPTICSV